MNSKPESSDLMRDIRDLVVSAAIVWMIFYPLRFLRGPLAFVGTIVFLVFLMVGGASQKSVTSQRSVVTSTPKAITSESLSTITSDDAYENKFTPTTQSAAPQNSSTNLPTGLIGAIDANDWKYVKMVIEDIQRSQSTTSAPWSNPESGWGGFVTIVGTMPDRNNCQQFRVAKNWDQLTTSGLVDYCTVR